MSFGVASLPTCLVVNVHNGKPVYVRFAVPQPGHCHYVPCRTCVLQNHLSYEVTVYADFASIYVFMLLS